jgi:hypothetical protein
MKRALALVGATTALLLIATGSASAACSQAAYCPAPAAVATGATNVSSSSATLNATINTNGGNAASYQFSLNGTVVGSGSIPDGTSPVAVSAAVGGLAPSTAYGYTILVTNGGSSAQSSVTFTTAAPAPAPTPEPTPEPAPQAPPATTTPSTSEPSTAPTTPTAQQVRDATVAASELLGAGPARRSTALSAGVLVVSQPTGTPTASQPTISGPTISFTPASVNRTAPISLFAYTCVDACRTSTALAFALPGASGRAVAAASHRIKLATQRKSLRAGQSAAVKVRVPRAVRSALKAGRKPKLTVAITTVDPAGTHHSSKTYVLKAHVAKRAARR